MTPQGDEVRVEVGYGRTMTLAEREAALAKLREPFNVDQIEKLPRNLQKNDQRRGKCREGEFPSVSVDNYFCGGFHAPSIHIDYVGHATITDRLLNVDPLWNWEPVTWTPQGEPFLGQHGMWGKLTVLGITRLGFGDAVGKSAGPTAVKETIGDFLRNAALRFGVGTYLWSKSEEALEKKRGELEEAGKQEARTAPGDEPVINRQQPQQRPQGRQQNRPPQAQPQGNGQGVDWEAAFKAAVGKQKPLEALRNQAKQAGMPANHPLFIAIADALTEFKPVEGIPVDPEPGANAPEG